MTTEEETFTEFENCVKITNSSDQHAPTISLTSTRESIETETYQNLLDVDSDIKSTWGTSGSTTNIKMSQIYGNLNKENGNTNHIESDLTNNQKIATLFKTYEDIEQEIATSIQAHILNGLTNSIYPIGSIYMSMNPTNPTILFGGVWNSISNCFLYCSNTSEVLGGSKFHYHETGAHAVTISEMPSHSHHLSTSNGNITVSSYSHTHTLPLNDDFWEGHGEKAYDECSGGQRYLTTNSAGSHTHTFSKSTDKAGGGGTHNHGLTSTVNIMPPYVTVYCWKRVS